MAFLDLPDCVQDIGEYAFSQSNIQSFRCPSRVKRFAWNIMSVGAGDEKFFSVEVPSTLNQMIGSVPSPYLRNIAVPPNCSYPVEFFWKVELVLKGCIDKSKVDLCKAFPSSNSSQIALVLKKRFDGLPIHKLCYYHSYTEGGILNDLKRFCPQRTLRSSSKCVTGNRQDVLGMTPLHILACSSKHDIHIYQAMIDAYPENLITEDKWGDIPLLYAFWGNAPTEVIQLLVESQKMMFPAYALDWKGMLITLGRANASLPSIMNFVETCQTYFCNGSFDWQGAIIQMAGRRRDVQRRRRLKARIGINTASVAERTLLCRMCWLISCHRLNKQAQMGRGAGVSKYRT